MVTLIDLLLVAAFAFFLVWLWLTGRRRVFAFTFGVATAAWLIDWILIQQDVGDADGFIDCWPSCTGWQHTAGAVFWTGPLLLVLLLVAGSAVRVTRAIKH